MNTRPILVTATLALTLGTPAMALAQSTSGSNACPPGSWFCAQSSGSSAPTSASTNGAKAAQALEPLPPPAADVPPPPEGPPPAPPGNLPPPPPVVVYEPQPDLVLVQPPPPYAYARPRDVSPPREWGLNLHLQGASFGRGATGDAGMGGGGAGLRFKPTRHFGLEWDLDFLGGTGYQGESRRETAFALNGLWFVNPHSRAQLYFLAGFGWSSAHVTCGSSGIGCANGLSEDDYTYFGGQLGIGLELRLSRHFALNGDVRGFIRTRVDDNASNEPEFIDADGRTTNTSGGALFTAGVTLYF